MLTSGNGARCRREMTGTAARSAGRPWSCPRASHRWATANSNSAASANPVAGARVGAAWPGTGPGSCSPWRPARRARRGLLGRAAGHLGLADLPAAQRPPVLYLMAPVAAVQAFGLGRACPRYAERLAGHDAALRLLARRRMSAYDALARLAPAGLAGYRSGDLLARLVTDIDSLADRWLRVRLPFAVAAALAGAGAVAVVGSSSAAARASSSRPACSSRPRSPRPPSRSRWPAASERQTAPQRGELAAATWTCCAGPAELVRVRRGRARARAVQARRSRVGEAKPVPGIREGRGGGRRPARGRDRRLGRPFLRGARGALRGAGGGDARRGRADPARGARGVLRPRPRRATGPPAAIAAQARVASVLGQPDPVAEPRRAGRAARAALRPARSGG